MTAFLRRRAPWVAAGGFVLFLPLMEFGQAAVRVDSSAAVRAIVA